MSEYADNLKSWLSGMGDAIRGKTGGTELLDPLTEFIPAIQGIEVGGGSSADLCYVTFMSEDGTVEYGKKAVAYGDNCADPIARGVFDEPTKESDEYYHYTHDAWATEIGGSTNSSALTNVTTNRIVYATFNKTDRLYTVRFFDGDTLKETKYVKYNETADYYITKDGYNLTGWEPSNENITADTDCYAQWEEFHYLKNYTWEQISGFSESGEAASMFQIGDTKEFTWYQYVSGSTPRVDQYTITAVLIGFNHDDLADGSGKAGMTFEIRGLPGTGMRYADSTSVSCDWDTNCRLRTNCGMYYSTKYYFKDVVPYIKQVTKKFYSPLDKAVASADDYVWAFSLSELGYDVTDPTSWTVIYDEGDRYPYYSSGKVRGFGTQTSYPELIRSLDGTDRGWLLRSMYSTTASMTIESGGAMGTLDKANQVQHIHILGFCI